MAYKSVISSCKPVITVVIHADSLFVKIWWYLGSSMLTKVKHGETFCLRMRLYNWFITTY